MIFVTGGAGLVGSALLKQLLQLHEVPVKALYRTSMPLLLTEEEKRKIQWIKGDVLDTSLLDDIMKDCRQVYHCAAVVSYHSSRRQQMYKINIEGTANMVNVALENKIEKFVHVSSVAAIGRKRQGEQVTEKTEWSEETNNSHYGKTKYLSDIINTFTNFIKEENKVSIFNLQEKMDETVNIISNTLENYNIKLIKNFENEPIEIKSIAS